MNENETMRDEQRIPPDPAGVSVQESPEAAGAAGQAQEASASASDQEPAAAPEPSSASEQAAKPKKVYVNAPPKRKEKDENRVHWGSEILYALGLVGRVILRMFSWVLNILMTVALIGMITGTIVGGVFALWIKNYVDPTIDTSLLTTSQDLTTQLYYMDYSENPLGVPVEIEDQRLHSTENRLWVAYTDLPQDLVDAFIAVEDHRFWKHKGVDWYATIGATVKWVAGLDSRGGSTITQQLVKNITQDDDVTIQRKVQEIFRALNLEKQKSKEEIIELYLNTISFGQGTYGIRAAAQRYFNKDVSELNLTECASLAAIPKSPTYYNPYRNPENNETRRNTEVLAEMLEHSLITQAEYNVAVDRKLVLDMTYDEVTGTTTNSWFTDAVIEDVIADLQEELDISYIAASTMLYSQGLTIYTTMDPFVQETLEEVFEDDSNFPRVSSAVKPECSMVVTDPKTGNILGLVGGRGDKSISRGFNIATMAKRSPGSSIKPLTVYAPALDAGLITYGSIVDDTPFMFNEKTDSAGNVKYTAYPANLPAVYKGLTTINSAVERSVNTIAMKVLDMLGTQNAYDFSQRIGLSSITDRYERVDGSVLSDIDYAPLALGALTVGVSPREMTQAYSFLANDGIYTEARTYLKVLDKNKEVLLDNTPETDIVVSEQTASIMTKMLQNVVKNGTAKAVTLQKYVDVAGKTGTATDDYDRWFCGYTPYYVGACWFGYTELRTIGNISTVSPATKIWDVVMTRLHQPLIEESQRTGEPLESFDTASGVVTATYCVDSGKLVTEACRHDLRGSRVETGYFTMETAPTTACDVHVLVDYDKVTGAVACADCPEENLTQVALIRVEDRDFPAQVAVSDAQYVWREWEPEDGITDSTSLPFFAALLGEERYCGTSGTTTRVVNSFCFEHYVEPAEETETDTEAVEGSELPPDAEIPDTPAAPAEGGDDAPAQNDPNVE
ncbi:MAG: PBP1A family penicillin-binding protein [Ruminococcaceae bacterium]|nr:PBP1A family penicillin-binding protein [Oscillospiraceae bacterium]